MRNAIWFSRHAPTTAQLVDAREMGWEIRAESPVTEAASMSIETAADILAINGAIAGARERLEAGAIFGVIPAPLMPVLAHSLVLAHAGDVRNTLAVFTAWNVARTPEGGKATFQHKRFVYAGVYSPEAAEAAAELYLDYTAE